VQILAIKGGKRGASHNNGHVDENEKSRQAEKGESAH
jgi:hypothetical protein